MSDFKVGSPVKLNGGSPGMTITAKSASGDGGGNRWLCEWYVESLGKFHTDTFPEEALKINAYPD